MMGMTYRKALSALRNRDGWHGYVPARIDAVCTAMMVLAFVVWSVQP